jgi:alpha-galactosidase
MIREISGDLQNTGVEYFVIDDGWMDYYGDWNVNKEKFSNGLQPVFEDLREKGFKPGLWISLATVDARSRSFKDFKQYAVKNPQGDPTNLHGWVNDFDVYTMDILSPYYTNNSLV